MSWRPDTEDPATITAADSGMPGQPPTDPGGSPPLAPWRKVVLAAVFVLLVGGIVALVVSRQSDSGDQSSGPPTAPTQESSTAVAPPQTEQAPTLLNTGDDWDAITRSMVAYSQWLLNHPRPELLGNYMHPDNPDFADGQDSLSRLANGNIRYDPPHTPVGVEWVRFMSQEQVDPDVVVIAVHFGPIPVARIVDSTGQVVSDTPAKPGNTAHWTLTRTDPSGRWLLLKAEGV